MEALQLVWLGGSSDGTGGHLLYQQICTKFCLKGLLSLKTWAE